MTMNWTRAISAVCVVGALVMPPASAGAQGRGQGQAHADQAQKPPKDKPVAHETIVIDRDGYVRVIREYARAGSLPPGLAKRESLPPGLRKQLQEHGTLPPGLQKHLIAVPAPWIVRLPPDMSKKSRPTVSELTTKLSPPL